MLKLVPVRLLNDLADEVNRLTVQLGTKLDQGRSVSILIRTQKAESPQVPSTRL